MRDLICNDNYCACLTCEDAIRAEKCNCFQSSLPASLWTACVYLRCYIFIFVVFNSHAAVSGEYRRSYKEPSVQGAECRRGLTRQARRHPSKQHLRSPRLLKLAQSSSERHGMTSAGDDKHADVESVATGAGGHLKASSTLFCFFVFGCWLLLATGASACIHVDWSTSCSHTSVWRPSYWLASLHATSF